MYIVVLARGSELMLFVIWFWIFFLLLVVVLLKGFIVVGKLWVLAFREMIVFMFFLL